MFFFLNNGEINISLTFCLFDKCSRTSKAESVMNHAESTFNCKATIEIDDQQYIIERVAKRKPNGRVKCDVMFNTIDETGQLQDLTGEQRSETNQVIRSMIGTYDDFVLTALSVQNDSSGFIDMSQTDKKDLLSQFLDITVFEQLHSNAGDEISEVKILKEGSTTTSASVLYDILRKISSKKIQVIKFDSLTTALCKKYNSKIILRGLRAVSDFEYEFQLAGMNRKLNEHIETIFLMSDVDSQVISSRLVKEIALLKGDLKKFITKSVIKQINKKV